MKDKSRVIKYQIKSGLNSSLWFWLVVGILNIVTVFVNIFVPGTTSGFYVMNGNLFSAMATNIFAVLIYLIIFSYENSYKVFPLCLSFSITRRDFFLASLAKFSLITLIAAIIQAALLKLDPIIVKNTDHNPLYNFGFFNSNTDNIFYIILAFFLIDFLFLSLVQLISIMNYKFGYVMWLIAIGVLALIAIFGNKSIRIAVFVKPFVFIYKSLLITRIDLLQALKILVTIGILQALSFFATIKANLKFKL